MPSSPPPHTKGLPPPGRRPCPFCKTGKRWVDHKDYPTLKKFTNYFGSIKKRYYTGTCLRHQRMLRLAIERARFLAIIAYRK